MKIERIASRPDRAGRYTVHFEDGETLRLYRQTAEDFGIYPGQEFTREEYEKLRAAASQLSAKMRAVRILSASSVSKGDLQHRLIQKGENPEDAKNAVAWMEEMHLIDDGEMARQVVRQCAAKGYGKARAKQALSEKRVPREFWEAALADYPDQSEAIERFLQGRDLSDPREKRRAIDALIRRGHTYAQIRRAMESMSPDVEFPEEM